MKTIHVLIATAALALVPVAGYAQSAPTTTSTDAAAEPQATDAAATDPADGNVGSTGTGTGTNSATTTAPTDGGDVGSTGTGTGTNDIGSTGTGTGTIGSTGTGTGTTDVGSTGTGTGTLQAAPYEPTVTLATRATSLRTPGTLQVQVSLAAEASLDPPQARSITVDLASSSSACTVPASVSVDWSSAAGGSATFAVTCRKAGGQTVTISSGAASVSFTTK